MFLFLMWSVAAVVGLAMLYAYTQSKDVFHPLMFIGPMMAFMYAWMPMKLASKGFLDGFFQPDQLIFVQWINLAGVAFLVLGCLSIPCRLPRMPLQEARVSPSKLVIGGIVLGCLGVAAWLVAVMNSGGITAAFSSSYAGGWDDNGYVRDGALLMFPAVLLILAASFRQRFRVLNFCLVAFFIAPWIFQAVFTARRGPTFMIAVILGFGWYLNHRTRPSLLLTAACGTVLGLLMLFLVVNRQNIYIGSDRDMTVDVTAAVEKPDSGNEFIYGAGGILSAEQRNSFYWGRRYLAQIVVRPIPHEIWPTKYEDFGLPEMSHNAGTGEGFAESLGWEGAPGSAPGIIADLWLEFRWLNMPALFLIGRLYCSAWRKAQLQGGPWIACYSIMAALSVYLVMQTMEAVIFRLLILYIPVLIIWRIARVDNVPSPAIPNVPAQAFG
jgi:hypothetical protein